MTDIVAEWRPNEVDVDYYREAWLKPNMSEEELEQLSDQEIREKAWEDQLYWEFEYEHFNDRVTTLMKEVTKQYKHGDMVHVSGSGIGWRNHSGERIFCLNDMNDIIDKVTPDAQCSIEVSKIGDKKLQFTVYHHDSPTGEVYTVTPVYAETARTFMDRGEKKALEVAAQ